EHYTPPWLADYTLHLAGATDAAMVAAQRRVLDPTCGSGVFLLRTLANRVKYLGAGAIIPWIARDLRGTDANPLAVQAARANLQLAAAQLVGADAARGLQPAVTLADALAPADDQTLDPLDLIVGNPPWVNWGDLPADTRERIAPLLDLSSMSGGRRGPRAAITVRQTSARTKTDIAFPILLHTARRLVRAPHARLAVVITASILQSERGAREVRSCFAPGLPHAAFATVRVADVQALAPFPGTAARANVLVLRPKYGDELPFDDHVDDDDDYSDDDAREADAVPVEVWTRGTNDGPPDVSESLDAIRARYLVRDEQALPLSRNDAAAPWVMADRDLLPLIREQLVAVDPAEAGWRDRAREGVNTRGANAIFWLRELDRRQRDDGTTEVLVENDAGAGRRGKPDVAATITHRGWLPLAPTGFVYPLLRGREVRPFRLQPNAADDARLIVVPHDADTAGRPGIPVPPDRLAARCPATAAWLEVFRQPLSARKSFRNFDPGSPSNPFHFAGLYNVGRYTFAPWRVVWRYIAVQMEAAVLAPPAPGQPLPVADCKLMVVPCESGDEAAFLAGLLNSVPVRCVISRAFVNTQLSTHMLDRLRLPAYNAAGAAHRALVARSHELANGTADVDPRDKPLNDAAAEVLGLDRGVWQRFTPA
ncbi:MAG: N-6 DNA methylase, partial [Planctomycetota bacterium]